MTFVIFLTKDLVQVHEQGHLEHYFRTKEMDLFLNTCKPEYEAGAQLGGGAGVAMTPPPPPFVSHFLSKLTGTRENNMNIW